MTVTQQVAALRKQYRKEETSKFKAWVRKEFGRALKPGDLLITSDFCYPDGYSKSKVMTYEVIGHAWDYNTPALHVECVKGYLKGNNVTVGKGRLREMKLTNV